jgi:hypothetical protein
MNQLANESVGQVKRGDRMRHSGLLTLDAVINLLLGLLLIVFPSPVVSTLGIPSTDSAFYPSILGAVLFGIGLALIVERVRGFSGLGLAGAISINMSGGLVLAAWLLFGQLNLPLRGKVFLWGLVLVLVGVSSLELFADIHSRHTQQTHETKRYDIE